MVELIIINIIYAIVGCLIWFLVPKRKKKTHLITLEFTPPRSVNMFKQRRYVKKIVEQLPDALDVFVRGMTVGFPLEQALEIVARETSEPISYEFTIICEEIRYGVRFRQALINFSRRVPALELSFLISAVNVQRDVGGDLSAILTTLSKQLRARSLLKAKVNALSAEARWSARIMSVLPFIIIGMVYSLIPDYYIGVLDSPLLIIMMLCAILLILIGLVLTWSVVRI